ncbi:hypothetical protein CONPUDRAFT_162014 [Coniophora puteana RWD-64-598 SS2]|uniref:Cyclic nucleotide-binding domain-containing protein n=1 Tax=Coniophora puteana (strain RWD-64-598) TaxID=741705 RepID=A0A5M3N027_CONPW|nr:uncharacterized protein CONPUDRAFT_162014 [Coniophora puteana RWD-64-598 SS2]EIW84636.1 hypothetical protein CONPUDRAFT_162014 [Coniophora puteana RWD-64-598 SS2]
MTVESSSTQVLIVGAGPTGLVAALGLLKNGISVRIIEKDRAPRQGQRGPGIQPRSLELYHFLGVPEILEQATAMPDFMSHTMGSPAALKEFPMTPYADPTPAIPFNNVLVLGQSSVERHLRSHLEKRGTLLEYGKELVSFEQHDDGVVAQISVKTEDGIHTETINAQYIIGADGARGIVRKQLGLKFLGETRETTRIITGDIRFKCDALPRTNWHLFGNGAGSVVSLRPARDFGEDDAWHLIMSGDKYDVSKLLADEDALCKSIEEAIGATVKSFEVVWISDFRQVQTRMPNIRVVNKFGQGRVLVAGDAAHVHSPTGGQGLNSGVQDAFNLAWKVALVAKHLAPQSLLETYTLERLPVITELLGLTTALLDKTFGPKHDTVENAFHRGRILYMLGVNCRASPIVCDERAVDVAPIAAYGEEVSGQLVAGDRAPDAPGLVEVGGEGRGGVVSLFDLFRYTHHTALVFAPEILEAEEIVKLLSPYAESEIARVVVVLPATGESEATLDYARVVVDKENHAHANYLIERGETRVVIVRPDGVVGAIVAGSLGIQKYFGRILAQ